MVNDCSFSFWIPSIASFLPFLRSHYISVLEFMTYLICTLKLISEYASVNLKWFICNQHSLNYSNYLIPEKISLREVKYVSFKLHSCWRSEMSMDPGLTPKAILILLHQDQWGIPDAFHKLLRFFSIFQVFGGWWELDWGLAGLLWAGSAPLHVLSCPLAG